MSSTQKRLPQPDFAELHSLKEALEEKEQVLARIQRENVKLTRKFKASDVNEVEEGVILRAQESGHKEDKLSKLSGKEETVIKHSRTELGERLLRLQNVENELEKSSRMVSMLESQLIDLRVRSIDPIPEQE